jgi:hypothetical protein
MFEPNKQAIIREYKAEKRETKVIPKVKRKSFSDILKNAQHTLVNTKVNGRIFFQSKTGRYVATNVSPYSPNFENNIEPKIKKAVMRLKDKGYLTLSSCQGHCVYSKRYITLAFYSRERAEKFVKDLGINKFVYKFFKPEQYMNTSYVLEGDKITDVVDKKDHDPQECVFSLNTLFERNYTEYCILEIRLSNQISKFNFKDFMYKKFFIWFYMKIFEKNILRLPFYDL